MAEPKPTIAADPTMQSIAALPGSVAGQVLEPAGHGGLGRSVGEFVAEVCDLAVRDSALAWLAATFNAAAYEVAALPGDAADQLSSADPAAVITTGPRGDGRLVDGRLSGRWASVVGAAHADWLLLCTSDGSARRVLVPLGSARLEPAGDPTGLAGAGICDVTVSELEVDRRWVFGCVRTEAAAIGWGGAAAAVVGSAAGLWQTYVERARAQLAASYGGDEMTDTAAAELARAASDIDAATLQITTALAAQVDPEDVWWAARQAVARARSAADRLLAHSRYALNASDPVTRRWRDVHAGCRLAVRLLDDRAPPLR